MKRVVVAAKIAWMAAMLSLLAWFVTTHSAEFSGYASGGGFLALAAATTCLLISKLILARLTLENLRISSLDVSYWKVFWIYSLSQLGKFLPGSLWQFVGRVLLYRGEGLPARDGTKLLALETLWFLGSAVAFGAAACAGSLVSRSGLSSLPLPSEWLVATIVLGAWYVLLNAGTELFVKKYGGNRISSLHIFVMQGMIWATLGLSFWLVIPAEHRLVETVGLAAGAFALGWAAGFVVPFAPAGLGVREAVVVALLFNVMPTSAAIAAASVNRLLYTLIDILLGAIAVSRFRIGLKEIDKLAGENGSVENRKDLERFSEGLP